jgi:NAD(P)-dependent dehydrogenase (short-subunit alcohol dehydrogenase family)
VSFLGLEGKVVLITGTGRGQGRAAAHAFAAEGAEVVCGDIAPSGNEPVLDVTDPGSVEAWVSGAAAARGRIDVVYNNAGAVRFGPIEEQTFEDWRFTLAAELDSVFLVTKAAWPHLRESRGAIVNVGSTAGLTGSMINARTAHTASKGGVIALTRQIAAEGAPHGIRANCISPGMIDTEGAKENLLSPSHPMRGIAASIPLARLGSAADVVNVALFLASERSSYMTGANVVVDGGWSAVLPGVAA